MSKTFLPMLLSLTVVIGCTKHSHSQVKETGSSFAAEDFAKVKEYLKTYCGECHTDASEGGFDYAEDLPKLASSKLVKRNKPDESPLWRRIESKEMPATGASAFPKEEDSAIVKRWIAAGAPVNFGKVDRPIVSAAEMLNAIDKDLKALPASARPFTRYLEIRHLNNQTSGGAFLLSEEQLDAFRGGLSTLVNSLSWQRNVVPLVAVPDTSGTVLRLDLRNYTTSARELANMGIKGLQGSSDNWTYEDGFGLTPSAWDKIGKNDTYHVQYSGATADYIRQATHSNFPTIRGDLFVFIAGRSNNSADSSTDKFLYYKILGIGPNFEDFNKALFRGRTISDMLSQGDTTIVRSGFAQSGVSDHNRLIERHVIPSYKSPARSDSFYWLSYDFSGSAGNEHLESHPLGPADVFQNLNHGKHVFSHAGGEVIFSLPNGLHGYLLFTSKGELLDQAPSNIVRYLDGKHSIVYNGVSCMDCHKMGMIEKADTIFDHIQDNRSEYTDEELYIANRLYLGQPALLTKIFNRDSKSYLSSKAKSTQVSGVQTSADGIGVTDLHASAVSDLFDHFNGDLTISTAASEVDLDEATFLTEMNKNPELKRILNSFQVESGKAVKRETFRDFFPKIVRELKLDEISEATGQTLCASCTATCSYSVFSTQNKPIGKAFIAESKASVDAADSAAFRKCNEKLSETARELGYVCKRNSQCTISNP